MTEISMDKIVRILIDQHDIPAYVEQTGGGCATIMAGERENHSDRYPALAGPGWFDGPGWTNAKGDLADFYIGPDDDGENPAPVMTDETWTETRVAEAIAKIVKEA